MADLASTGQLFINSAAPGAGALTQLLFVKDGDVKDDRKTDTPPAVGVPRAAGFRRSEGGLKITLNEFFQRGKQQQVNWDTLNNLRSTFTLVFQVEGGGPRFAWTCQVSTCGLKFDGEGNLMKEIELAASTQDIT